MGCPDSRQPWLKVQKQGIQASGDPCPAFRGDTETERAVQEGAVLHLHVLLSAAVSADPVSNVDVSHALFAACVRCSSGGGRAYYAGAPC